MPRHKIGLSTKVVTDRPMREAAEIAARAGYTGLEIFGVPAHLPIDTTDAQAKDFRRLFDDLGLSTVTICSYVGGFAEGSDKDAAEQLEAFRRYLGFAATLDCDMVRLWADRLGRGVKEPREDHFLRAAYYLAIAADLAQDSGVRVLLENHLAMTVNADMTLKLLSLIARPNVVVNFDPGNMYLAGQGYGRAATLRLKPHIGNVQVKEGSMKTSQAGHDATLSRGGTYDLLLGEGDMDHMSYLRPLHQTGYGGYYMAECHKTATAEWPSDKIAHHEYGKLVELLDEASQETRIPAGTRL